MHLGTAAPAEDGRHRRDILCSMCTAYIRICFLLRAVVAWRAAG